MSLPLPPADFGISAQIGATLARASLSLGHPTEFSLMTKSGYQPPRLKKKANASTGVPAGLNRGLIQLLDKLRNQGRGPVGEIEDGSLRGKDEEKAEGAARGPVPVWGIGDIRGLASVVQPMNKFLLVGPVVVETRPADDPTAPSNLYIQE
ncbi:Mitogen-activated protein kinase kinase kinase kinase 1 [Camelus dromedarius]|uniref:Mitogen-activated protein kinase kinase kinase kinase 1 n=1 Tax=Camelus dromedarius TaxID=9838 RepID=A0A5N4DRW4_CAMDR|nr:Mitogen-activated protein kinase kinase kinase kinase 1 [Camelus dromedarius]